MILVALFSPLAFAQGIEGKWRTFSDLTGKPEAVLQISQNGGVYSGKIVSLADGVKNECRACQPAKPLIGLTVLSGLKEKGGRYEGGKIYDPANGATYNVKAELANGGSALKVRGYLGASTLWLIQTWQKAD
ncbi:MAG: DUF2147 domain-containing protein [Neisseria sp.]|nr:DUF2147 domain-containing protein [Neisseria sp.]